MKLADRTTIPKWRERGKVAVHPSGKSASGRVAALDTAMSPSDPSADVATAWLAARYMEDTSFNEYMGIVRCCTSADHGSLAARLVAAQCIRLRSSCLKRDCVLEFRVYEHAICPYADVLATLSSIHAFATVADLPCSLISLMPYGARTDHCTRSSANICTLSLFQLRKDLR